MEDAAFMIFDYSRERPPEVERPGFYIGVPASEVDDSVCTITGPFETHHAAIEGIKAMVLTGIALKLGADLQALDDEDGQ